MQSNTVSNSSLPNAAESLGSRRRRLWDLPSQALCPVIGVCLPMPLLRRRLGKVLGGSLQANDYELHCGAIKECQSRSPIAESLQRELEQRFIRTIRLANQHKTTKALELWWSEARESHEVAAGLWATLTHARCDAPLQEQVLQDIHMLQHQLGSANRADLQKLSALSDENSVLARELAQVQLRSTRLLQERSLTIEQQAAELLRLRAALLGRETLIESLQAEIQELHAASPALKSRQEQALQIRQHLARIADLEQRLHKTQEQLVEERLRKQPLSHHSQASTAPKAEAPPIRPSESELPKMNQAVLCVGGRQAAVPIYRQLIEKIGGRFLHHDGGEEDATSKLDASLAAADLVICQTGCISHDAYWRVKEHCKRLGKRCVFVDKPSRSSLQRALTGLNATDQPPAQAQNKQS
ncbi:DUF2325 domain-containing protein [Paucibacter sp. Y2R2-4]|uniref:DUF2325 domain-containing protein n=1 Tax=Paucibacter sp. Y2R2-4 TaxID=2893553 RepID=UPI0021E3B552|nr:DUF2325 domain-containing protein [Paucibacter sp. Y2R2-4]MCV2349357.1 DUF2325 domain-containing protein [Paucibacter sp. Y2R2-4]